MKAVVSLDSAALHILSTGKKSELELKIIYQSNTEQQGTTREVSVGVHHKKHFLFFSLPVRSSAVIMRKFCPCLTSTGHQVRPDYKANKTLFSGV